MTQVTTSSNSGFFGYIGTGGTVKNVTVTSGTITQNGSNTSFTGGIAGNNQSGALIEYCYSTGSVIGTTGAFGIAGSNPSGSTVRNCVALCPKVTTTNSASVSRIGSASGTLTNNKARADMKIGFSGSEAAVPTDQTGVNSEHGANVAVGSSTALSSVFSGWDTAIWNINTSLNFIVGGSLPTLKPNPQSATTLPAS